MLVKVAPLPTFSCPPVQIAGPLFSRLRERYFVGVPLIVMPPLAKEFPLPPKWPSVKLKGPAIERSPPPAIVVPVRFRAATDELWVVLVTLSVPPERVSVSSLVIESTEVVVLLNVIAARAVFGMHT